MAETGQSVHKLSGNTENDGNCSRGRHPSPYHPRPFAHSLDLVCRNGFPAVFEWPKSVKAFSSHVSAKNVSPSMRQPVSHKNTNSRFHRP